MSYPFVIEKLLCAWCGKEGDVRVMGEQRLVSLPDRWWFVLDENEDAHVMCSEDCASNCIDAIIMGKAVTGPRGQG